MTKLANAVFKGGGVKGIALTGALCAMEAGGWGWKAVAGTSAGAITACLVAAGYSAGEVHRIINGLNFKDFEDKAPGLNIFHLLRREGIYKGEYVVELIDRLLTEKLGRPKVTFADLPVPLRVVATDVTNKRMITFPDDLGDRPYGFANPLYFPVADAVRASMSIPLFFEPYHLQMPDGSVATLVDGGLMSNFPIHLFAPQGGQGDAPTFGFYLSAPGDMDPQPTASLKEYLVAIVDTVMAGHDNMDQLHQSYERSIIIPTGKYGTTEFDIDQAGKDWLFTSGKQAGEAFLQDPAIQKWLTEFFSQVTG